MHWVSALATLYWAPVSDGSSSTRNPTAASRVGDAPAAAPLTRGRVTVAILIGLLGALFIWVMAPYNNFLLNNSFISDNYLPEAAVIIMLALVLLLNPCLRLFTRRYTLDLRQRALIFGMLLIASTLPGTGLLRQLPYSIAKATHEANLSKPLSELHQQMRVPSWLFPDALGYNRETPASDQFLDELEPNATVPWGAWVRPLVAWGSMLFACWLLMIGLGLIVFPQWRDNERLQFPLLTIQQMLMEEAEPGRTVPPLYRSVRFWTGCGLVLLIYALNGLNHHTGGAVPSFPLGWDLSGAFSEGAWRYLGYWVKRVYHIYFVLVGMAFFMPARVGFSIWFTMVAYAVYQMLGTAYFPPFQFAAVHDQRNGAMIAVTLCVLWLGRAQWSRVARAMWHPPTSEEERRNRVAGWIFTTGCLLLAAWLVVAGVHPLWALALVTLAFMVSLLIARIVAETGIPFIRVDGLYPQYFMALLPAKWITASSIYLGGFLNLVFQDGSRVSATVMATHALGLDKAATPRQHVRLGYLFLVVLSVGFVVCGAVHLGMSYHHPSSLDGQDSPLSSWGTNRIVMHALDVVQAWARGSWGGKPYNELGHLAFGFSLALGLQWACLLSPRWPLHPIGLLMVGTYFGPEAWASILIGWIGKRLLVHYGGVAAVRTTQRFFLGLIVGEVFSAIIWTLVPVVLMLMGHDPVTLGRIQVLPR